MSTHIDHCTARVTTPQHTGVSVGTHEPVFYHRDLNDLCDLVHAWQDGDVRCHVVTEGIRSQVTRLPGLLSDVDPDCILATGKVTGRKIDGRLLLGSPKVYTRKTDPDQTVVGYLFTSGDMARTHHQKVRAVRKRSAKEEADRKRTGKPHPGDRCGDVCGHRRCLRAPGHSKKHSDYEKEWT